MIDELELDDLILKEATERWDLIAHGGQIPPLDKPWFVYLMRSGRGGGKTRAGSEFVLDRVRRGYRKIALVGRTAADVRDTMVEIGESSILNVARPWERPIYEPSKRRLTFPSGAIATLFNGDDPDALRGPQHDTAWIDELAKFKRPQECWDNLVMGLRVGPDPKVFVTTTPRPIPLIKDLITKPDTIDVRFSTYQNAANLSPIFLRKIEELYKGTRLGRQELEGEILDDNPRALWKRSIIDALKVAAHIPLIRIAVGVDPAVTSNKDSDATGIVVAGKGVDNQAYVLGDYTIQGTPKAWATEVLRAFQAHRADRVVGEGNNGGELVEVNVRTVAPNIPYKMVWASRGKAVRAEPVSSLYEQGRVHHVGSFPELEDEMVEWEPGAPSPNRMDALVWAIYEVMGLSEPTPNSSRFRIVSSG